MVLGYPPINPPNVDKAISSPKLYRRHVALLFDRLDSMYSHDIHFRLLVRPIIPLAYLGHDIP